MHATGFSISSRGWLTVKQYRKMSILKLTFKSLYEPEFPAYFRPLLRTVATYHLSLCYNASFEAANLLPLTERRAILSEKFITKNKQSAGPLNNILSSMSALSSHHGCHLRSNSCGSDPFKPKTQRFSNFITCKYRQ